MNEGIALMCGAGSLPAVDYPKVHAAGGQLIACVLLDSVRRRGRARAAAAWIRQA